MSSAVSAFLTPLLWPLPHIWATIKLNGNEPSPTLKASPYPSLASHIGAFAGSLRAFAMAYFVVYGLYSGDSYPAFGRAYVLSFSWMWPIIVRNVIGTWLICGFWDWWLYFGPMKEKLFKFKITPKYPSMAQMRHDFLYTTLASIIAAVMEIGLCHWWASGSIPMARTLGEKPLLNIGLALTVRYWRLPHFWITHRLIHPWKTDFIPDFGKVLYRYVHSLHHKSYNITAFSGTNMHPIEAAIYYSAAYLYIPLGAHPTIALASFIDLALGAWVSHDGHVYPGTGSFYHTLHHLHFDCNYGSQLIPFDYWLGCYAGSKAELAALWGKQSAGREANESDTGVHADSPSPNKVD